MHVVAWRHCFYRSTLLHRAVERSGNLRGASIAVKKDYLTEQFLFIVVTKNQRRVVLLPTPRYPLV